MQKKYFCCFLSQVCFYKSKIHKTNKKEKEKRKCKKRGEKEKKTRVRGVRVMSFTPISSGGVTKPGGRRSHAIRESERVSAQ